MTTTAAKSSSPRAALPATEDHSSGRETGSEVLLPVLVVQRAEPEGVRVKDTKSGRSRRVPVADHVLPIVRSLAAGREADDLLCVTSSAHQLHASAFKRTLDWASIANGRRIHDLLHTAA